MYLKQKYIKTDDDVIIVFSELLQHNDFKKFNPVSAGFTSIGVNRHSGMTQCTCYGKSVSLGMESHEEDSRLAFNQILGNDLMDYVKN